MTVMVNVYEGDPPVLVYREANEAELADLQALADVEAAAAAVDVAAAWVELRMKRDRWLAQTDWIGAYLAGGTIPADIPTEISDAITANADEWTTFRQTLRDLPAAVSDPTAVTWPSTPDAPVIHFT